MLKPLLRALLLAALSLAVIPSQAQTWPAKPMRLIVPFPPGGPVDHIARVIGPRISAQLGQPILIENRSGGGGTIGLAATISAPPDGYTFGFGTPGGLTALPHVMKVSYAPDEVQYLTLVARVPQVVVVNSASGINSFEDLLRIAKQSPGKLNFGSAGNATTPHLGGELLRQEANINIVHVPYKGAAPAVTGLLGNEIQILAADLSAVLPFVTAGRMKAVAVNGPRRLDQLPGVPSTTELGLPNIQVESNYGIIAPTGTPAPIAQKFREAVVAAVNVPEVRQQIATQGAIAVSSTPEEYRQLMQAEYKKWGTVIKKGGIKLE